MAKNNVADLLSVGSLFTTQAERDEAQRETVRDIPLEEISDFPNHPFKVRMDESMMEMVESVILLNMDQKDKSLIDDVPDEDTPERPRSKGIER